MSSELFVDLTEFTFYTQGRFGGMLDTERAKAEAMFNPDNHSVNDLSELRSDFGNSEPGSPGRKLIVALAKCEAELHILQVLSIDAARL